MRQCNSRLPWSHFQRSFTFAACRNLPARATGCGQDRGLQVSHTGDDSTTRWKRGSAGRWYSTRDRKVSEHDSAQRPASDTQPAAAQAPEGSESTKGVPFTSRFFKAAKWKGEHKPDQNRESSSIHADNGGAKSGSGGSASKSNVTNSIPIRDQNWQFRTSMAHTPTQDRHEHFRYSNKNSSKAESDGETLGRSGQPQRKRVKREDPVMSERQPKASPKSEANGPVMTASLLADFGNYCSSLQRTKPVDGNQMFTVLSSTPKKTSVRDLLDSIPAFDFDAHDGTPLLVFLVTPSFAAEAARDDGSMFSSVIQKASFAAPTEFETIFAVVDRLPAPLPLYRGRLRARYDSRKVPIGDVGSEGLGFVCVRAIPAASDTEQSSNGEPEYEPSSPLYASATGASLSFSFDVGSHTMMKNLLRWGPGQIASISAQIPLSNTIFQTGSPHTLIHSRWSMDEQQENPSYNREWTRSINDFEVHLPIEASFKGVYARSSLALPLVALTTPRPVAKCMGNIIRQLALSEKSPDGTTQTMPASQELEAAVSEYFKARAIPSQAVSIWALVIPTSAIDRIASAYQENFIKVDENLLKLNWSSEKPDMIIGQHERQGKLWELLRHGAKFCKVMSGGGGWGKKAGLLSLDPNPSYNRTSEGTSSAPSMPRNLETSSAEAVPLDQIARPGDLLQFYIWPYGIDTSETHDGQLANRVVCSRSAAFGSIPDTTDSVDLSEDTDMEETTPALQVFNNHIGVLSEGGLALKVRVVGAEKGKVVENIFHTKIDMPFARFGQRIINTAPEFMPSSGKDIHEEEGHYES